MNENLDRKTIWNEAGKAGMALGLLCVACMAVSSLTAAAASPFLTGFLSMILWAVKFAGCIWLMAFFMKKLVRDYPGAGNADTMRLGTAAALLSALIVSAATFANMQFIQPDVFREAWNQALESYSAVIPMNSDVSESMESMIDKAPTIYFFTTLIYCFIYGYILSAILSRNIPKVDIFAGGNDINN